MNIRELIDALEDIAQEYSDDIDVRIASQPEWPFENVLNDAKVVNLSKMVCEDCDGDGMVDDTDDEGNDVRVTCTNCNGSGFYNEGGRPSDEDEYVVYLEEGHQIGYLPGAAAEELGWSNR